ncbi:MAG: hypothetical protein M3279_02635 [Actinomycetota bacterium]|nr:hypothetical protein [Actinomycetota bacterium]
MVEPGTAITAVAAIAGAAKIGAPLVQRVLGPTPDMLGNELAEWTEHRLRNVGRIVEKAGQKLPPDTDPEGAVPPRVLARIIADGSFCEDTVAVEYLGGVMASSRSGVSRDDRGATLAATIGRMSTYELRAHYIFYKAAHDLLKGTDVDLRTSAGRIESGRIFLPSTDFGIAMAFSPPESPTDVLLHTLTRLKQEDLIGSQWGFGPPESVATFGQVPEHGVVYEVSLHGIQLFAWAFGHTADAVSVFLNESSDFEMDPPLEVPIATGIGGSA